MNIVLYKNTSPLNAIHKTLTNDTTITGIPRDDIDILYPIITLAKTPLQFDYNYCKISDYNNRYYFITDVKTIRQNVYEIHCAVDVLTTYASVILAQTAVIERNENMYNLYLNDPMFKTYQNTNIFLRAFKNGENDFEFDISDYGYILAVAGG